MAGKTKKNLAKMAHTVTGIGWANLDQACTYANVSMPTLRTWRKDGLLSSKVGGCVRIKYSHIDIYLESKRVGDDDEIDMEEIRRIADEVVASL